ncbi:MAG: thiol reductant ABC exporter subunit CydC [Hamadaea sp.]|uniref:thiol reductant ABC exporter subunit CydC n=1 Tax=Hamadaea sp. TaxID=2024425 RepID=UPI0017D7A524|nr:thiol reductant ABC exporter subunit CydC [Hamadaea sp.]NUR74284.1 thiol reductant ABC exporter subunit CydC [Hamadaea sp.]NUT23261.1 thiol reductant ABC exporter subunit CydC [Hamadaea sp.]
MLWRLGGAGLLATVTELSGLGLMATATWLLMTAAGQPPITALTVAIVTVRALAISRGAFRYAERLAGHDAVLRIVTEVRARVFANLASRPELVARRGDALSRMVSDVDAVQDLVVRVALPAFAATLAGVVAVAAAIAVDPLAGLVLAVGLLICGLLLPGLAARLTASASATLAPLRAAYSVATIDLVHGAADLAAFGARASFEQSAAATASELAAVEKRLARQALGVDLLGSLVIAATAAGVVLVALARDVPGVWIGVLAVGTLAAGEIALSLVAAARKRSEISGALARLRPLLSPVPSGASAASAAPGASAAPAAQDPRWIRDQGRILVQDSTENPDPGPMPPTPPTPQAMELDAVTVRYREGGAPALEHFSLSLPPGSKTALVGPSGAGKSTVLGLLAGAIQPSDGVVRYAGEPLPEEAYELVGGLFADAAVFHASVLENVTLGRPSTMEERAAAAEAAGLLDWIEAQPDGWDTLVGEEGAAMSGGQRQRLTLARALLHAPPVLVLDEPTEGLDPVHADEVLRRVLAYAGDRTVVLVTHRTAETSAFDTVVRLT